MRLNVTLTRPQADFFCSTEKYPAFVGGFGSGKTQTLHVCALADAAQGADALVGIYAPTYDLLKLVNMTRTELILQEHGIRYKAHTQDKAIYTSQAGMGDFIFRTLDDPARIVGYETFRAHVDEIDTLKADHARAAWNQVIARNRQQIRAGAPNQARAYTTPEGFRFTHDRWVVNGGKGYAVYRAPTHSNPFLPDDYIQGLRDSYPGPLIEAYIEGKFVNLTSGTVYSSFNRDSCNSNETLRPGERVYLGQDFNVGDMASVLVVKRGDSFHAVDEMMGGLDTPWLIEQLAEKYGRHKFNIYPDASGKGRKTVDASKSDLTLLRSAEHRVVVNPSNPSVRDRIVSVNNAFSTGRLFVNTAKCPTLTRSLEQQAYAPNGEPDKSGGFDHPNDALGYFAVKELRVRRPVADEQPEPTHRREVDYGAYDDEGEDLNWKTM